MAEGAAAGEGKAQEQGLQRMMSESATSDVFVAPASTNKGKSQRAILDFRSKLAAITNDGTDSDEEEISLAVQLGTVTRGTAPSAEDTSPFDPNRQRLSGGNTRAGRRALAQASVRGGLSSGLGRGASNRSLSSSRSLGRHQSSSGSGRGRRPMSLLVDPDTDSD